MVLIYRADKGSPLTSDEVDGNFHDLDDRVTDLEDSPPAANGIANIVVDGTQMTIVLEDATELGPYTLPQANFRPSRVGALDAPTDGTYEVTAGTDANRYWRYDGAGDLTVVLPASFTEDGEVSFRQVGNGPVLFEGPTDVVINGIVGYRNQTAFRGATVTAKYVAAGEWDLIGLLAEDVTA